ncbi:MAG: chromosomal replication initiator protein DnaA [Bacteroidaceae bacterium]|nr:chromosomal replication initiator protein DnaA [Bacteroidaceae bacterium]
MHTQHPQWNKCVERLKQLLPADDFAKTIGQLTFVGFADGKLRIGVPSREVAEAIDKSQHASTIGATLAEVFGNGVRIAYTLVQPRQAQTIPPAEAAQLNTIRQRKLPPLDPQLNKHYTFENFVSGASNKLALSVARSIADKPHGNTFNPFFIYGPSGVGKTHLANAIGVSVLERNPEMRVLFVSAHVFKTQYTESVVKNNFNNFINFYQSIDVLIIDDVQEVSTAKTQQAFFHIFNHLQQSSRQIIMTCDRPPVKLEGMEDRMLTRFKWGMVAEMEMPDATLRRDIVKAKLKRNGIRTGFSQEVISYISENVVSSVREIEGVINAIMAYSIVDSHEIDLELVKRIVARMVNLEKREISMENVLQTITEQFGTTQKELFSKSRKQSLVRCRQLAMYLTHKYTNMAYAEIGRRFGGRDHTTVIHACTQISTRISSDSDYRHQVEEVESMLKK